LKLNCDKLLSNSAFKFNLRRYIWDSAEIHSGGGSGGNGGSGGGSGGGGGGGGDGGGDGGGGNGGGGSGEGGDAVEVDGDGVPTAASKFPAASIPAFTFASSPLPTASTLPSPFHPPLFPTAPTSAVPAAVAAMGPTTTTATTTTTGDGGDGGGRGLHSSTYQFNLSRFGQ